MIQKAFWDNAMSVAEIKVWHKHIKDSWESVESDPHSEKPATSRTPENIERVQASINKDQSLTVRELEADLGIPKTTVSEILMQDLGMKCVLAKFVSQLLLPQQMQHHAAIPNDLIQITTNEPDFLKKVITGDDSWVCNYDSENSQLSQWKSPGSLRLRRCGEGVAKSQQDQDHINYFFD